MVDEYCSRLTLIPDGVERTAYGSCYYCDITSKSCIARERNPTYPVGPKSIWNPRVASFCPARNVSDDVAQRIRENFT